MHGRGPITVVLAAVVVAAGCGGDDLRFSDKQIIDKLNLEESENGFSVDGDVFCEVKKDLLNDADQVDKAAEKDSLGLVIASAEGNAGVEGVPVFSPDCKAGVKKKLNKLDPTPKD